MDGTKHALVTTTYMVSKEGNTDMVDKEGELKKSCGVSHHSSYFRKKKIDTVNKTEKSQASNKTLDIPKSNKNDTVK